MIDLTLRSEKSTPITFAEMDSNLQKLQDAVNRLDFKNIFTKASLAIGYSTGTDPSTWDWTASIQSAIDEGGAWFFPPFNPSGVSFYDVSGTLQIRHNKTLAMFSSYGSARRVYIKCKAGFVGKSLLRQWDSSWYGAGEIDQDQRPADLNAYTGLIDRYLNIHHMGFYVSEGVTALDLVSLQETSQLNDLVFNGDSGVNKGYPIRVRSGGGSEVSFNGTAWKNITVYSNNWKGMVLATGAGSDIDIDNFVTSPSGCTNSPFEFDAIDVTIRNLHCEAFSAGKPTILHKGTDLRITESFFVIKDGQGDLVKCENPFTTGYSRTGVSISQTRLYPVDGNDTNVTNRNSINIINDVSQAKTVLVPMAFNGGIPTMIVNADKSGYKMLRENSVFEQSFSDGIKNALIQYAPSGGNVTTPVLAGTVITLTHVALKSMMVRINWQAGSVYQAAGNDYFNNAQWGRIGLGASYNGSEYQQSTQILTDKAPAIFSSPTWDRVAGTLQLTVLVSFTYGLFTLEYI